MKQYDMNKTEDFIAVARQLCSSYDDCDKCINENNCCINDVFMIDCTESYLTDVNEAKNVLQAWYDNNIRIKKIKLTEKEKCFLESFFYKGDDRKIVRETTDEVYLRITSSMRNYDYNIRLDTNMFQFIKVGESMTLEEIMKLVGD